MINVEMQVRLAAPDSQNVYFLTLFACCREPENTVIKRIVQHVTANESSSKKLVEIEATDVEVKGKKGEKSRAVAGTLVEKSEVANYTLLFGCKPANGVAADTQFVDLFIKHINGLWNPDDGTVQIPECFSIIDVKSKVNFESTSGHLGRNLTMMRQDNRVGPKMLIVVTECLYDKEGKLKLDQDFKPKAKTQHLIDFFTDKENGLGFKPEEVLLLNEEEAKDIENILNQSRIFKTFETKATPKLQEYARKIFKNTISDSRQMLTIFLNESRESEVRDFIVGRNPELALEIKPVDEEKTPPEAV